MVGGHDRQAVPEMQQFVGHHVTPDHPVAFVGIPLHELAEAAGEGAAVAGARRDPRDDEVGRPPLSAALLLSRSRYASTLLPIVVLLETQPIGE